MADFLDYISIAGFRSIRSTGKLPLRSMNVLIGANGSGKSNFISAFAFLNSVREGKLREHTGKAGGAGKILHFGPKATQIVSLEVSFSEEKYRYHIDLSRTDEDEFFIEDERCWFWDRKRYPRKPFDLSLRGKRGESGISGLHHERVVKWMQRIRWVQRRLDSWRIYHFHDTGVASPIRATADVEDSDFLRKDGSNLASYLYFLREHHGESYEMIRKTIQQVAPFFHDFRLEPLKKNKDTIRLHWKHKSQRS